jgi:hypothetical protein
MAMNEEPATLICLVKAKAFAAHPESVVRWCSICGQEVWVSLGGVAFHEKDPGNVTLVCTECAPGVIATHGDPKWGALDPEGRQHALSPEFSEHVIEVLNEGDA